MNIQTISTTFEACVASMEEYINKLKKELVEIKVFKNQAIVVNDLLKQVERKFFKQLNKIYNFHHDLISFTDQVNVLMEDDNDCLTI